MALWIHNITPDDRPDSAPNLYVVKINREELCRFEHVRAAGAAECFRAAADALDAGGHKFPHDVDEQN